MWNRYNKQVMEFFGAAESYAYRVYDKKYNSDSSCYVITECPKKSDYVKPILDLRGNWDKLLNNPDITLPEFKMSLDIFTNNIKDYRVYYAFLNAYHAIMHYYRYNGKYNLKDAELEEVLAEWKLAINPKQNILQNIISKFVKKNQK